MSEANQDVVKGVLRERLERYRAAYQHRNVEQILQLFADDGEFTAAPGTFRGKPAIRRFLEWDAKLSPTTTVRDNGVGIVVGDHTAVWERIIALSYKDVPYQEHSLAVVEFDDDARITAFRSYYDKLNVLDQITSGLPGPYGWVMRKIVGLLVSAGSKGLTTTPAPTQRP
jgi:ketosteroid isomerase-like protein